MPLDLAMQVPAALLPAALENVGYLLAQTEVTPDANEASGFGLRDWMTWLGRWHFVVLHLPIGLLVGVYLIDLTWVARKSRREGLATAGGLLLMLAMITAVLAALFGWFLHETAVRPGKDPQPLYPESEIGTHQWLGIGLAAVTILAWFARTLAFKPDGKVTRFLYPVLMMGTAVLLFFTGHTGGSSVHGETHLTRDAPPALAPYLGWLGPGKSDPDAPASTLEQEDGITAEVTPPDQIDEAEDSGVEEISFYDAKVWPILEQECLYCHDASKSDGNMYRGGYDMSSFEGVLAGGVSGLDAVIPSDPEASELLRRVILPEDDPEFMPKSADKLPDDQIELIRQWIAAGASPSAPVSDFVEHAEVGTGSTGASALSGSEPAATPEPAGERATEAPDQTPESSSASVDESIISETIAALSAERVTVTPIFRGSDLLDVSFTSIASQTTDAHLESLVPMASRILRLDLQRTAITDAGMVHLQEMTQLRRLILRGTNIGDDGVAALAHLPSLERLVLFDTAITDQSVEAIASMSKLTGVEVGDSQMTAEGVALLRDQRPDLEVID